MGWDGPGDHRIHDRANNVAGCGKSAWFVQIHSQPYVPKILQAWTWEARAPGGRESVLG